MSYLVIDTLNEDKSSVAQDLMQQFEELGVVHIRVGSHDLLAETDLDDMGLFELMKKIKESREEIIFVGPL